MKMNYKHLLITLILLGVFSNSHVHAAVNWSLNNSTIWSDGNVGIGTNFAPDPLTISKVNGTSTEGKVLIGDGVGSWWLQGNKPSDGKGYNNIAINAYYNNGWYKRTPRYEVWNLSTYVTNNNSGYFTIFHADASAGSPMTSSFTPVFKITSAGKVFTKELNVVSNTGNWGDYIFEKDYKLMSISDLENYVQENKHLPDIPTAQNLEANGIDLGDMQTRQMKKIEELTLYIIDLQKQITNLKTLLDK